MFKKYDSYKYSGKKWLGEIPLNRETKRVKDVFRLITDIAPEGNNCELLSIYASIGVRPRSEMKQKGNKSITTDNYWIVRKGDFIVNKLLAWMGAIGLSNYDGVTSPAYDIIRKKVDLNNIFFEYLFRTELYQSEFKRNSKGIMDVRLRLYFDKFGFIYIPFPNLDEQNKIVEYLDKSIVSIDKGIEILEDKKEKFIKLKDSLINKSVLMGIKKHNDFIEIESNFLTKIPRHWNIKRIKEIAILYTGNSISDKEMYEYQDNTYSYISTKDISINDNSINYNNGVYIPKNNKIFKLAKKDSTLLCIEGGSAGKKIAFITNDVCFVNKLCSIRSRCSSFDNKYIFYFLQSGYFKNQFNSIITGLIGGVSINLLRNFFITVPPKEEQIEIANYLDEKTSKIDEIVKTIDENIDRLKEYRKVLINDTVTGKIKVI